MAKKKTVTAAQATQDTVVEDLSDGASNALVLEERREEWLLEQRTFDNEQRPVPVEVSLGLTKNLGDFQSARMDIRVGAWCLTDEVPDYVDRMQRWIEKKLSREVRRIDASFVEPDSRRRGRSRRD